MSAQVYISLINPCAEKWSEMTSTERGRFCNSCQKTVIDFTGFTDAQLHTFFSSLKCRNVCGRFYDDQLSREIAAPVKPHNKVYQLLIQLSASFLLFPSLQSSAKANPPTHATSDSTKQYNKAAIQQQIAQTKADQEVKIVELKTERTIILGGAEPIGTIYIIDGIRYDKDGSKMRRPRRSLGQMILGWFNR